MTAGDKIAMRGMVEYRLDMQGLCEELVFYYYFAVFLQNFICSDKLITHKKNFLVIFGR